MTPPDLDTEAVVEPLWFGQDLISSSERHWDVHLCSKIAKMLASDDKNNVNSSILLQC